MHKAFSITVNTFLAGAMRTAQLICSLPINNKIHGSQNATEIQSIGCFRLTTLKDKGVPDFFVFSFPNTTNGLVEFVFIPFRLLINRLTNHEKTIFDKYSSEIVFWLMPDNCLFDCTNIGAEGEWYFMNKGRGGRMADNTDWDYTTFLK